MQTRDFIKFSQFARILPQMLSNTERRMYIIHFSHYNGHSMLHTPNRRNSNGSKTQSTCVLWCMKRNCVISDVTTLPIDFNVHTANNPTAIRRIRIIALIANTYHIYNCELPFHVLFIIQCMPNITLKILVGRTFHTLLHSAFIIGTRCWYHHHHRRRCRCRYRRRHTRPPTTVKRTITFYCIISHFRYYSWFL